MEFGSDLVSHPDNNLNGAAASPAGTVVTIETALRDTRSRGIDMLDAQLLLLLNQRARVAQEVGHVKAETNAPVFSFQLASSPLGGFCSDIALNISSSFFASSSLALPSTALLIKPFLPIACFITCLMVNFGFSSAAHAHAAPTIVIDPADTAFKAVLMPMRV